MFDSFSFTNIYIGFAALEKLRFQKGYTIELMKIVSNNSIDPNMRVLAAIDLKNFVKKEWKPNARQSLISHEDAKIVKENILNLMCSAPIGNIQSTLSEVVCIIGEYDFHKDWPNLISDMVQKLNTNDFNIIQGVLKTADSIFRKYRDEFTDNDDIVDEIKHILESWVNPMLVLYKNILAAIPNASSNKALITKLFECLELLTEIYYSLTNLVLPEFFDDHLEEFMTGFSNILAYNNELLESKEDDIEDLLSRVKSSILQSVNLFVQKYSDEINPYIEMLLKKIWDLTLSTPPLIKYNNLLSRTIEFFKMIAGSYRHHNFYSNDNIMDDICKKIIIPNITYTDLDEENFNYDAIEYIRKDIEDSDVETRRRAVYELIKEIRIHHEQKITEILQSSIPSLIQSDSWKQVDVAFFIISALSVISSTKQKGVQHINLDVDIKKFFDILVFPQLKNQAKLNHPILLADSIKFITVFRNQLPKQLFIELLPILISNLNNELQVIHTYAAWSIERFLSLKDEKDYRYTKNDINPFSALLFEGLFSALKNPDSKENEYIMKCIMRVSIILKEGMSTYIKAYISTLAQILAEKCKNPVNPLFNHYLFESFATVIRYNSNLHIELENHLFPIFEQILIQFIPDFTPYVFQLMALLLDNQVSPLPQHYKQILPQLFNSAVWDNSGNIPGLVRLLYSYSQKAPEYFTSDIMMKYLNVYANLVRSSKLDHEGFRMINTLIEFLPRQYWKEHIVQILRIMLTRLQNSKTHKFHRMVIIFFSIYSIKHGIEDLISNIELVQAGIFTGLSKIWLQGVKEVHGSDQRKLCSAALTLAACKSQVVIQSDLWGNFIEENINLLEEIGQSKFISETTENSNSDEYQVRFNHLQYATIEEMPLLKLIPDPKLFFAKSFQELLQNLNVRTLILQKFSLLNPNIKDTIAKYFHLISIDLRTLL